MLSSFFDPHYLKEWGVKRTTILKWAWYRHLASVLNEDYYPQRADAYLRALDSEFAGDVPGAGGREFEQDVRDFFEELGFSLHPRVFKYTEHDSSSTQAKEADIITDIEGRPLIVEVYTSGAHSDKTQQLDDYGHLYTKATATDPLLLHMTDRISHASLTPKMFRVLLEHPPRTSSDIPGDYRRDAFNHRDEYSLEGFSKTSTYADFGPDYEPPSPAQCIESWVSDYLTNLGFSVERPVLRGARSWSFVGPMVEFDHLEEPLHVTFVGDQRDEHITRLEDETPGALGEMIEHSPYFWERGLRQVMDIDRFSVIELSSETQSMLSPSLFHALLSHDCENE